MTAQPNPWMPFLPERTREEQTRIGRELDKVKAAPDFLDKVAASAEVEAARLREELAVAEPPPPIDPELEDIVAGQVARMAAERAQEAAEAPAGRRARLVSLADVEARPTHWIWDDRIPVAAFTLLAGREGVGKSTVAAWLTAQITRGLLPGEWLGKPQNVGVYSTEEALHEVIVPKLMAAGADMTRVFRLEVINDEDVEVGLHLTRDLDSIARQVTDHAVRFLYLDPITSLLGPKVDTHRDSDTRTALEPLARFAENTRTGVLGLIHLNKNTAAADVVNQVMGSRAFTAVPRAVHVVTADPTTPGRRLFATPKNNMGPSDGPTRTFTIELETVRADGPKPVVAPRVAWGADSAMTIQEAADLARQDPDVRSTAQDAKEAIQELLDANGGTFTSAQLRGVAQDLRISVRSLQRHAKTMGLLPDRRPEFKASGVWFDPATVPSSTLATPDPGVATRDSPGESV